MASDYTVYIQCAAEPVRAAIANGLGIAFPGALDRVEQFGVPITFQAAHAMEDDLGIPFSEYPVCVEFRRSAAQGDAELRELLCRTLACLLGRHVHRALGVATLVGQDSQEVVESFHSSTS